MTDSARRRSTLLLATLCLAGAALAEAPRPAVESGLDEYRAFGRFELPAIPAGDIDRLAAGEAMVWQLRDLPDSESTETSSMGIVGARVIDAPRILVWLSALGGNSDYRAARRENDKAAGRSARPSKSRVTHSMLSMFDDGSYTRYQHVNMPWPVRDRHWVIYCEKNVAVAAKTDDRVWEHTWALEPDGLELVAAAHAETPIDGLTGKMLERSIYLPSNQGAWIMIDLGDNRTLLLAYMEVELGGTFPAGLVRRFTQKQLKSGLEMFEGLARRVADEYDELPPIHDGNGAFISRTAADRAADQWLGGTRVATASESKDKQPHP